MTQTEGLVGLLEVLMSQKAPRLNGRVVIEVCYQQKIFIATPLGSRVVIRFGRQTFGASNLMSIIDEAIVASEALLFGISTASCIRLDPEKRSWYEWELRQREQGSD